MNRTIEVLMKRDNLTRKEAEEKVREVYNMMEECNFDPNECEEIMYSELNLELDYLFDILF